ncbi:MAG: Gfo/Idh/MocA family oxidoreductase [Fuerstiella sp.]|nr:Gfo/Idh/MocA family oxidoreductase [Fuerstiella sp.]MCP4510080.1 Gfo/Idh/MocA family oxidoreductase [Fuerstiella sp.]
MSETLCRWGILSTAGIAMKNWHSIAASGNAKVVAVASRSVEKAQAFIDECQGSVPVAHQVDALGTYEELLGRDDIDAVYVPLPTGLRTEWVVKAANTGKHVMVEKPCGVSADDVQTMIDACNAHDVQFMDGVMFMHSARLPEIRKTLDDGSSVGEIRRIASQFSFCADEAWVASNIRASSNLEPAGCLGDLGWYTIRISLWAMNFEMPTEVRGRILYGAKRADSPNNVPMEFQGELHFANGTSATFYNSFRGNHQQWVNISGTKGYVEWKDFVLPYLDNTVSFDVANHDFVADGCRFNMEKYLQTVSVPEISNNGKNTQETKLFRNFSSLVLSGKTDSHWPDIALKTQQVLDAALTSAQNGGGPVML